MDRARARRRIGGRERGTEDPFRGIVEVARIELALGEQSFDLMRERNSLASQPGAHRDTQIESRLDVIELRALHEAIERCRDLGAAQRAVMPARRSPLFSSSAVVRTFAGAPSRVAAVAAISAFSSATFDFWSSVILENLLAHVRARRGSPDAGFTSRRARARIY
jgi:hypothetical protein